MASPELKAALEAAQAAARVIRELYARTSRCAPRRTTRR